MLAPGASHSPSPGLPPATGAREQSPRAEKAGVPQAFLLRAASHAASVSDGLEQLVRAFWGDGVQLRFFSASPKIHYFWRQDNFYVSQAGNNIHLRLSDDGCSLLLDTALGKREDSPFSFSALTGFEASLLTTFSKEALTFLAKHLILPASLKPGAPQAPLSGNNPLIHLIWALSASSTDVEGSQEENDDAGGKLILSLPASALKLPPVPEHVTDNGFPEQWVYHAMATVTLGIGAGQLPIGAIGDLEPDDIIVLEESDTGQLFLSNPITGQRQAFPVKLLDARAITRGDIHLEASKPQDTVSMSSHMTDTDNRQALLDNLMIDVGAQFTPVKMPLHQIKQMSEGLIVEVGDLVHNDVLLTVEGKPLALGELVIVGDKFGVRIVSVTPDGESMPAREVRAYPAAMPESPPELSAKAPVKKDAAPTPKQEAPKAKEEAPATPKQQPPAPAPEPAAEAAGELNDDFLNDDFDDDDDDW